MIDESLEHIMLLSESMSSKVILMFQNNFFLYILVHSLHRHLVKARIEIYSKGKKSLKGKNLCKEGSTKKVISWEFFQLYLMKKKIF